MIEVETHDVATFGCRNTFARHKAGPNEMVGSADGRKLAIADQYAEGKPVRVWDIENPDAPPVEVIPKGKQRGFALSHDGSRLGIATTKGASLWDATNGSEIFTSGKHRCALSAVCFHPTRPLMTTGDNSWNVFLWDFTGRVLTRHSWGTGVIHALAFSPDGLRCAAAETYHVVIWDLDL
jgi:WD40 repeat protein